MNQSFKNSAVLAFAFIGLASASLAHSEDQSGPWEESCVRESSNRRDCSSLCESACRQHGMGMDPELVQGCIDRTDVACSKRVFEGHPITGWAPESEAEFQ